MLHPLHGEFFENWATMELLKAQCNPGRRSSVCFLRDKQRHERHELDAVIKLGPSRLMEVEIRSGATIASNFFKGLDYWHERLSLVTLEPWMNLWR